MEILKEDRYKKTRELEHCIVCGNEVNVLKTEHINRRLYYVEGAGQLCSDCYKELYEPKVILDEKYFKYELDKYRHIVNYQEKKGFEFVKRSIDIIFSLVTIIPATILIVVFSIIIMIESPGNPIFSQVRVGKNGKLIKIHKLRSMHLDAEAGGQKWAEDNDSRVTKVGRFIRKHRVDELPQLFDVLTGEMSLIGPRPEVPKLTKKFNDENPGFVTRLLVTPGLSGWAQINGGYNITPREKWLRDNEYIEQRDFKMYFEIFYLTIKTVLTGSGAR